MSLVADKSERAGGGASSGGGGGLTGVGQQASGGSVSSLSTLPLTKDEKLAIIKRKPETEAAVEADNRRKRSRPPNAARQTTKV